MVNVCIINKAHLYLSAWLKRFRGENSFSETCLVCKRNWAFWIWSWVPVMVIIRSSDPSRGSSILIAAPESWRICLIRWPALPMMEPASCHRWGGKTRKQNEKSGAGGRETFRQRRWIILSVKHKWDAYSKLWKRKIMHWEWHGDKSIVFKDMM